MAEPISPKDFKNAYGRGIPDIVIETVNNLLLTKSRYEGQKIIHLKQDEVVDALVLKGIDRHKIFSENMLDFEPLFRAKGWTVNWNKGAYFEPSSASHWEFKI